MYDNFKKARAKQRADLHNQISGSMRGIKSRTAKLVFDLTHKDESKLDINKNAAIKAMELVSELLARFDLPAKPKLEYYGVIKNASDGDGVLLDGIVRVGASINTLMGHKANIDIPVLVRNKSLLEPAVFFYNDAPYVMCGPAIDELVRSGTLMKELQPRRMFSGPLVGEAGTVDKPRTPIINLQHMFSPGIRNPWTFKRFSSAEQDASEKRLRNDNLLRFEYEYTDLARNLISTADRILGTYNPHKININTLRDFIDLLGELVANIRYYGLEGGWNHTIEEMISEINANINEANTLIDNKITPFIMKDSGLVSGIDKIKISINKLAQHALQELEKEQKTVTIETPTDEESVKKQATKEPRKRTNIDTPAERPEIWPADLPQQELDQAEREKKGLIPVGSKVKLTKDYEVRNRGGGTIIVPSGEEGCVIRDEKGDGMCLYVDFCEMGVKDVIPYKFLKKADTDVESQFRDYPSEGKSGPQFFDVEEEAKSEGAIPPSEVTEFTPRHQKMLKSVPSLESIGYRGPLSGKTVEELLKTTDGRKILYHYTTQKGRTAEGYILNDLLRKSEGAGPGYSKPTIHPDQPPAPKSEVKPGVETVKLPSPRRPVEEAKPKHLSPGKFEEEPEELGPEEFELMAAKKAAAINQIKNQIQDMLREGYQRVDIKAAIKEQYPEQAEEALAELES